MIKILKMFKKRKEKQKGKEIYEQVFTPVYTPRALNRPNEGEIVKINNIKIKPYFKEPRKSKLSQRKQYYKEHDYFRSTIVINDANFLEDGYTTYLIAKQEGFDFITVVRKD